MINRSGVKIPQAPIRQSVRLALENHSAKGSVTVVLTDDVELRELNLKYREIDSPTDVLSFCYDADMFCGLGDLAISIETAKRQAATRGADLNHEVVTLAIHGALHLAGLDDESDEDRVIMLAEMNRVLRMMELPEDSEWCSHSYGDEAVS